MGFLQKFIVKGFLKHFKRAKAKPEVCAGEYSHFPSPQLATTGWAPTQQPYQTEHNQRMEFEDGEAPPVRDEVQCSTCGRSFAPHVLARHANVCKTSTNKKRRKVFDSSRQRAEGTDISQLKPVKPKSQSSSSVKAEPPKKPNNWRQKHDDFIASIRASKVAFQAVKEGKELPPPPPPTYDPDYIQCPHCQRRFNESAAERHINFCKEQAARIPNKGKLEAKKTPSRTQFKPPSLKKPSASAAAAAAPAAPPAAPSTSTRLPQRAGLGQPTGIAYNRTSSAGATRNAPSGYTSPPSGVGGKTRVTSSGYGSARNTPPAMAQNRRSADNCGPRDGAVDAVNNGGVKSKFCHSCGTRYPVESAKFCCECGIRRMCF